jgi:hypothetical protein
VACSSGDRGFCAFSPAPAQHAYYAAVAYGEVTVTTDFTIVARRLCRIRSDSEDDVSTFPVDSAGFLDPASVDAGEYLVPGALVPAEGVAAAGAFVLLGEPGLGKTTFFSDIVTPAVRDEATLLRIDGAALDYASFEGLLGRHLEQRSDDSDDAEPKNKLIVVLDQADESPIISTLSRSLRQRLAGRKARDIRFLVACRTAD